MQDTGKQSLTVSNLQYPGGMVGGKSGKVVREGIYGPEKPAYFYVMSRTFPVFSLKGEAQTGSEQGIISDRRPGLNQVPRGGRGPLEIAQS